MALAAAMIQLLSVNVAPAQDKQPLVYEQLRRTLEPVYNTWRASMVRKDYRTWKTVTSESRQMNVYNRILSEKKAFPASVFVVPVPPPSLKGLRAVNVNMKGATATATYFGKVNFGVGGEPTDNLLVLHFVGEGAAWKYNGAEFISLTALPDVRKQLQQGNYTYVKQDAFKSTGVVPKAAWPVARVQYIAKVYAFCPGREVKVKVNKLSDHRFQNDRRAEVVIGGAKDGLNSIQLSIKDLPGSKGGDAMTVRVYLMSQVKGVKPIKVFEYQVAAGGGVVKEQTKNFRITPEIAKQLSGR